jgi:BirA family biotin operon repressor/biotin-[acetyl-CoA-carboxylase] ligase
MIGKNTVRLEETDSTNRYLMDWLSREKPEEGTLVITSYQSAGRGMERNTWESGKGMNLTFSFVIYPDFLAADAQFYLNKAISLGVYDVVAAAIGNHGAVSVKWPNDIYIGDHKVAGMLIQTGVKGNRFEFAVVGIGLNVNQEIFLGDAPNPVSLKGVTGRDFNLDELLQATLDCIEARIRMLRQGNKPEIDGDYLKALYRFGELSDYIYKDNLIRARIKGVSRYGQLQLEIPGEKLIECDLKEVRFVIS